MKRFYCTICRKVKRVRRIPLDVMHPDAEDIYMRVGTCTRHTVIHVVKSDIKLDYVQEVLRINTPRTPAKTKRRA